MTCLEERATPDIGGTLFRDNNFDGAFTVANDNGFYAGVTVTAYDSTGATKAVQTGIGGVYTIPTAGLTGPFRIEVTVPSGYSAGPIGVDNQSTVRFVSNANATGVNFGIVNPLDYSQANPTLFTSLYSFGNSQAKSNATDTAILSFPYTAQDQNVTPTAVANVAQVGSVYGLAYSPQNNLVYAGAFVRRFVGVGPSGTGAIYLVDRNNANAVTSLIDLNNVPAGMVPAGSTANDFKAGTDTRLSNNNYDYFNDAQGTALTSHIGLGDVDISADGRTLYVTNLATRELIEIPLTASGALDTTAKLRRSALPGTFTNDISAFTASDLRPFAISIHDGVVYVGATYTAETSQKAADLRAYVFAFNPATGKFSSFNQTTNQFTTGTDPVLSAHLDYQRLGGTVTGNQIYDVTNPSNIITTSDTSSRGASIAFNPWANNQTGNFYYPQPILSDIEFDRNVMVLGIRDRHGDTVGWYGANPAVPDVGAGEGDLLRAQPTNTGGYVLESGGVSNGVTNAIGGAGSGQAKLQPQGPGGARFYWSNYTYGKDDTNQNYGFAHPSTTMGGLYQVPGGTRLATTNMDPNRYSTGGISWFDNLTGNRPQNYQLYAGGELGKANGMGDLQAFTNQTPLEIGDRVWADANRNGIQDPGDLGISNVQLELWDLGADGVAGGTGANADAKLSTATTDSNGNYLFSGFGGTSTGSAKYGLALQPNRNYEVRIPNLVGQAGLAGYTLTKSFATDGNANPDIRDSNAVASGNVGVISVTTGGPGSINHTFDAGFQNAIVQVSLGNLIWNDLNNDGLFNNNEPGIDGIVVSLYKDLNGDGVIDPSDTLFGTQTTAGGGLYQFDNIDAGKYIVAFTPPTGFISSTGAFGNGVSGPYEPGLTDNTNNADHGTLVGTRVQTKSVELFVAGNSANPDRAGNDANFRQDFGLFQPYSLGNRVWLDVNNNGQIDNGEQGIDGVTVRLLDSTGTNTLLSTTTANGGYYRFDSLTNGQYIVEVSGASGPLAGLRSSTGALTATGPYEPAPAPNSKGDSFDYGSLVGANFRSGLVTIGNAAGGNTEPTGEADLGLGDAAQADNRTNLQVDFGFVRPLSLGNRLFIDVNNNGVFDAGDMSGPANVTINLLSSTGTFVSSTTTTNQGYYLFTNLYPGQYVVEVAASNFTGNGPLVGYVSSTGGGNGATTGAYEPIATLAGDNKDSGSTITGGAVRSAIVTLTSNAAPTGEPATPGITDPANDANSNTTVDFGFVQVLTLGNLVFDDVDNNGQLGGTEVGIANVPVALIFDANNNGLADDPVFLNTTTNAQGFYQFTNLFEGKYFVRITPPNGYVSSSGTNGSKSGPYEPAASPNDKKDQFDDGTFIASTGFIISDFVTLSFGVAPLAEAPSTGITDLASDANSNRTVDFGLFRPLSVGNRVWDDVNNNGVLDKGETGITNVAVTLYDSTTKAQVATTTTDSAGYYLFPYLTAGSYYIEVIAPAGYSSSTGAIGGNGPYEPAPAASPNNDIDNVDDGTQISGTIIRSNVVTLSLNGEPTGEIDVGTQSSSDPASDKSSNLTVDFGLFRSLTIGNLIFNDANNNGTLDAGEVGIGNVVVNLWSDPEADGIPNAKVATTTTNGQGSYLFTGLGAGTYLVQVDTSSLPGGYWLTSSGKNGSTTGPFEPAPLVSNGQDQVDDGTLTNGSVYSSPIVLAAGTAPTGEPATPGLTDPALDANSNLTIDFGFYQPVSVGNQVFVDANNNGSFDPATEKGLANVPVRLIYDANKNGLADDAVLLSTTTNANGNYLFNTLLPGTYFVEIDAPAGYLSSTGKNGSATSGPFEPAPSSTTDRVDHGTKVTGQTFRSPAIVLTVGSMPTGEATDATLPDSTPDNASNYTIDFGVWRPLALGNQVFFDANNNGLFDSATETGVANVPVSLFDTQGTLVASTTTASDGTYLFSNLGTGDYYVEITAPVGYASSSGTAGSFSGPNEPAGDPDNNVDNDDNGTATLLGGTDIRSQLVTLVPGTEPTNGDTNLTVDFGLFRTMSLGNLVWNDANNNGKFDTGEVGIAAVSVRLYADANGDSIPDGAAIQTTTTDKNGNYLFTQLTPGQYIVEVADPAGFVPSSGLNGSITSGPYQPAPGPNNDIDNDDNGSLVAGTPGVVRSSTIVLTSGQEPSDQGFTNLTVDFGYFQPLSIGNLVWNDANNNGQFDAGEKGLAAAPVRLFDSTGTLISSTQTDINGNYSFGNLIEGNYTVAVDLPTGFTSSTGGYGSNSPFEPAPGPNNNVDNDDNGTTSAGQTVTSGVITLNRGQEPNGTGNDNLTIDFGAFQPLSVGNQVFFDANNNGKLESGETGIAGVTVRIYRDDNLDGVPDGAAIATQTTNATGNYLFTGLAEGSFVIEVDTPTGGYRSSTGKNGFATGPYEPAPLVNANPTDGDDNGSVVSGVVRSTTVTLTVGSEPAGEPTTPGFTDTASDTNSNLTVDFGFFRPMAIGNLVFNDANNNGKQNIAEPGLPNVLVSLLDSNGVFITSTTTDANGLYQFDNLSPGKYLVEIAPPAGFFSSTGGVNGSGLFEPAPTPNGLQNGYDVGTTTGPTIRSGPITLIQDQAPTIDGDGDANTDLTIDFGLFQPLALGNLVWNDVNNNGLLDSGETGLGAVTVNLWSDPEGDGVPNTKLGSTTTNGQGSYLFTGLGEGTYIVQVDTTTLPTGYISSSGTNGSLTGPYQPAPNNATDNNDNGSLINGQILSGPIALTLGTAPTGEPATPGIADTTADANSNATVDFGFYRPLALGNLVWSDYNNNGKVDTGEPGVPNLGIQLFTGSGTLVASSKTDANGNYRFDNLIPGDYYVEVTPGAGVGSSTGLANAYEPGVAANGDIDNDDNGTQTAGLGSIVRSTPITLTLGGEPAENGFYNPTLDIGLLATAKVSGYVYRDPNIDGQFQTTAGDSPLGGVTITITGTDAGGNPVAPQTTRTDANGFYQFTNLPPGTYTIHETQPGGILVDGIDTVGSLGGTSPSNDTLSVTLVPNDNGLNYNFGEIPPANAFGNVYVDSNRNGKPDPGERPIPGVAITISGTAFAGTPLARPLTAADVQGGSLTIFTNAAGRWEYPTLPPGSYTFSEAQPSAYQDAQEQNGDPQTNPTITNDRFSGVSLKPFPIGGPYNFGEIDPNETDNGGKRDFLGSTVPGTQTPIIVPDGNRPLLTLPLQPSYTLRSGNVNTPTFVAYGSGPGSTPLIRVFDFATGGEKFRQFAYESTFIGGVRVAIGDINGDGIEDIVTSTGPGGGPRIRVFSGDDGRVLLDTFVFESTFRGGVFVATGDVNGDGRADIIVGAETGGGPRVRAIDGVTGNELMNFFAFDQNQRGGVRIAAADFNADGKADIVATTGVGVTTRVKVINAATMATLADFAPYESNYTGGVFIAAGDITGDGVPDIAVGADEGGGPRVQVFSGSTFTQVNNFFAFEPTFTGGVRLATADLNKDGKAELIVTAGPGGAPRSRIYQGSSLTPVEDFYPFDPEFTGGSYVG